jgi:hypothetical protein
MLANIVYLILENYCSMQPKGLYTVAFDVRGRRVTPLEAKTNRRVQKVNKIHLGAK